NSSIEPPQQHDWQLRAVQLILEAARQTEDEELINSEVGSLPQLIRPIFDIESRARDLALTKTEIMILNELRQSPTIEELIAWSNRPTAEVLRSLYALLSAGILDKPTAPAFAERIETESLSEPSSNYSRPPVAQPVANHSGHLRPPSPIQAKAVEQPLAQSGSR